MMPLSDEVIAREKKQPITGNRYRMSGSALTIYMHDIASAGDVRMSTQKSELVCQERGSGLHNTRS